MECEIVHKACQLRDDNTKIPINNAHQHGDRQNEERFSKRTKEQLDISGKNFKNKLN